MALEIIGTAPDWKGAFDKARELLVKEQLTAVAVVSEQEYASGHYVATQLKEFERTFGCIDKVVDNLEAMSPMLYGEKDSLRLAHGPWVVSHPHSNGNDWLLAVIYK